MLKILKNENIDYPKAYIDHITKKNASLEVSIIKGRDKFKLYSFAELCEKVDINHESYLRIKSIKGFLKSTPDELKTWINEEMPFDELLNCLIIGYENTSYLLIDCRDKEPLWIFESGDFYIEKTGLKLSDIIEFI